jgi:hypothetical protein
MLRSHRQLLPAVLFIALAAQTARAADLSEMLPENALAYVGWSQIGKVAGDEISLARMLFEAVVTAAPPDAAPSMEVVREVLTTALAGLEGSGAVAILDITPGEPMPTIDGVAILDAGAKGAGFPERLAAALKKAAPEFEFETVQIAGAAARRVSIPPAGALLLLTRGDLLIIGSTEKAIETVLARTAGGAGSLARSAALAAARKKVNGRTDGIFASAFIDIPAIIQKLRPILPAHGGPPPELIDDVLQKVGITALGPVYLHIEPSERGMYSRVFISVRGARRGLLKMWDQKTITDDDLKIVSKDAYWAGVGNFDLAAFWRDMRAMVEQIHPEARAHVEQALMMAGDFMGSSIETELLPAFGDTWTFMDAPSHGGFLITGIVMVVEANDPERLTKTFQRLFGRADALASSAGRFGVQLAHAKRGAHEVEYAVVTGLPIPFAPAWAIVDKKLIFGLSPQAVFAAADSVDPAAQKSSILDNDDFKAARAMMPKDVISVGYSDVKRWVRIYYPFGTMIATAVYSMNGAKPQAQEAIGKLPMLSDALSRTHNEVGVCAVDEDGIVYYNVGSTGLP